MRESPNGMASASQADSRGFDSRLSLQKREAFLGFSFLESCIRIEPQAHACYDLRQRHAPRLSVRARRALRPRGANSRRSLFPQAHACYDLRQWHVLRLSVRVRRALRPCGANSRLLLVRVQSDYKITLQTATGKLSDLYVKSAPAISRGAFLIDFFLVMRRWKSDRCNGLHTS